MKDIKFGIYHLIGNDWKISDNELIRKYKEHNFDCVNFYCNGQTNEEITNTVVYSRKLGLKVDTFHGPLKNNSSIWTTECDEYMSTVFNYLNLAKELKIKYFVLHTCGKEWISFSEIGLNNYQKILNFCEENNIVLLLENLRTVDHLIFLTEKLKSPNLKICLDTGHSNIWCYKPLDFISKFKYKIKGVHMHDNDGKYCSDQHLLPLRGSIDWKKVIPLLYKYYKGPLTLEIDNFKTEKYRYDNIDTYLDDAHKSLEELKTYINYPS